MNILAIGAHIGDAELMSGPYLCQLSLEGASCYMLALTSGERGNPEVEPGAYKEQKLAEAAEFSSKSGIPYQVFSDIPDAELFVREEYVQRVMNSIQEKKISHVVTHWRGSFHPDHRQAHDLVSQAVLRMNLQRTFMEKISMKYAENWEDMEQFCCDEYVPISNHAMSLWSESIKHEKFIHGTFSKFRYLDYYSALMTIRGCLSNNEYAIALKRENPL